MKFAAILFVVLAPLVAARAVSPPGSVHLIRPNPNIRVPDSAVITYGFAEDTNQIYGLVKNITMYYMQPDGSQVASDSFGSDFTNQDGSFDNGGYSPDECRNYPGTSMTSNFSASQPGNYTLFWDITYVMSSDPTKANSTYCGPGPFSKQNWLMNSTVIVVEASLGSGVDIGTSTTDVNLPSSPTGRVNGAVGIAPGHAAGLLSVLAMVIGVVA